MKGKYMYLFIPLEVDFFSMRTVILMCPGSDNLLSTVANTVKLPPPPGKHQ